jgi:hypothetical protein
MEEPMKISKAAAMAVLREEARLAEKGPVDAGWEAKVERISKLCVDGVSKTHITFLGTAMLAKSVNRKADLYAIKPKLAPGNKNAFSARTLCHGVIVPIAAELGISLGVTGREPLNNQPYFRMTRLGDKTPVHAGGRAAFDYMLELVKELSVLKNEARARVALRAFIAVRSRYQPRYTILVGKASVTPERLAALIADFVREDSEGGKRAQATVAGLIDVFAGTGRVESGRINDPSRKYPGDVCIRMAEDPEQWEKAFEVRDKPMSVSDVQIFGKKCVDMGVREAAAVMLADNQSPLDAHALSAWASSYGIGLTLFHGWEMVVDQVLFWAELPKPDAAILAVERIEARLIAVEASLKAVKRWQELVRQG